MKNWRMLAALLLSLALVGSMACNPFGGTEPESTQQLVEVVRGDLAITVSASGNIEVSRERKLAFGIGGRVDKMYVEENDEVSKGEVLARLETDALELALTQAQVAHAQAQVAVAEAEVAVTRAEMALTQAQVAHTQAQVTLQTAEEEYRLATMLWGRDTVEVVAIKKRQVEAAQQSQEATRQSLELATQSLEQAQKQIDKATLVAPFAGIVARLYDVDEGDTISPYW